MFEGLDGIVTCLVNFTCLVKVTCLVNSYLSGQKTDQTGNFDQTGNYLCAFWYNSLTRQVTFDQTGNN